MHSKNIIHRDIKLDNILINELENKVKIIDFGFAIEIKANGRLDQYCGTPVYMSP